MEFILVMILSNFNLFFMLILCSVKIGASIKESKAKHDIKLGFKKTIIIKLLI